MSVGVAISWGIYSSLLNYLLPRANVSVVYSLVFFMSIPLVFLYGFFMHSDLAPSMKELWLSFLISIGASAGFVLYASALKFAPSSLVSVASSPFQIITVLLASIFLHEPVKPKDWLFLLLVAVGVVFMGV